MNLNFGIGNLAAGFLNGKNDAEGSQKADSSPTNFIKSGAEIFEKGPIDLTRLQSGAEILKQEPIFKDTFKGGNIPFTELSSSNDDEASLSDTLEKAVNGDISAEELLEALKKHSPEEQKNAIDDYLNGETKVDTDNFDDPKSHHPTKTFKVTNNVGSEIWGTKNSDGTYTVHTKASSLDAETKTQIMTAEEFEEQYGSKFEIDEKQIIYSGVKFDV